MKIINWNKLYELKKYINFQNKLYIHNIRINN